MLQAFEALMLAITLVISATYSALGIAGPDVVARPYALESCSVTASRPGTCDPVNLVFPGKSWQEVRQAFLEQGWTTAGFGSRQMVDFGLEGLLPEDEQLFLIDGEGARFHVRLWQGPGNVTIAAVHHEAEDLRSLTHRIDRDWEFAEAFVVDALCPTARSCAMTGVDDGQDQLQGRDGQWRGWANDARLTVIVLR